MKKTKRLGAVLLAIVMTLSLSITAFADPDPDLSSYDFESDGGSIYIHKYDATGVELDNIADGTEMDDDTVVGKDAEDEDVTLDDLQKIPGIEFTIEEVVLKAGGDPSDEEDYEAKTDGIKSTLITDDTGTLVWENLPEGVYRITEESNNTTSSTAHSFLVRLPFMDPTDTTNSTYLYDVHVYPKNDVTPPPIQKDYEAATGNITAGDILNWKITVGVPVDIGTAQVFTVTDTPSLYHAYVADSLKVYYISEDTGDEVYLTEDDDYTLAIGSVTSTSSGSITVELTVDGKEKLAAAVDIDDISSGTVADRELYITYQTKINITAEQLEAVKDPITNEAEVNFTNSDGYVYKPNKDDEQEDVYGLEILKIDQSGNAITSADAKFKIYTRLNAAGNGVDTTSALKNASGVDMEYTTNAAGYITVAGLHAGTYYIVETAAPNGFNLLTGYMTVVIGATPSTTSSNVSDVSYSSTTKLVSLSITNLKGFDLPLTGGTGAIIFTIAGLLMLTSGAICITVLMKKKANKASNA